MFAVTVAKNERWMEYWRDFCVNRIIIGFHFFFSRANVVTLNWKEKTNGDINVVLLFSSSLLNVSWVSLLIAWNGNFDTVFQLALNKKPHIDYGVHLNDALKYFSLQCKILPFLKPMSVCRLLPWLYPYSWIFGNNLKLISFNSLHTHTHNLPTVLSPSTKIFKNLSLLSHKCFELDENQTPQRVRWNKIAYIGTQFEYIFSSVFLLI